MGVNEANKYDRGGNGQPGKNSQPHNARQKENVCWKDPNKVCKCEHPQQGVFCGRYPIPTD